jgi:anhydro-N-acetylmuramic acid kinase
VHRLIALAAKPKRLCIGLISGTSVDGVDAALVEITDKAPGAHEVPPGAHEVPPGAAEAIRLRAFLTYPIEPDLRAEIFALFRPETGSVDRVSRANFRIGRLFAEAAVALCREAGVPLSQIDLIGSHGQTVWHDPKGSPPSTLQIGDGAVIAELTGCVTVSDFRVRDMAAGGEGAPLVPYADYRLLRHPVRGRAAQNIGGIANVTYLPPGCTPEQVIAFDTGPGNMIADALCQQFWGEPMDRDGRRSAAGRVIEPLLADLMAHSYLAAAPPKSTGRELFGVQFAQELARAGRPLPGSHGESVIRPEDLVATAVAFTARSIADAYRRFVLPLGRLDEVIVSGGGASNPTLMAMLRAELAPVPVLTLERFGLSSDAKEALAFALLAHDAVLGLPTNLPLSPFLHPSP